MKALGLLLFGAVCVLFGVCCAVTYAVYETHVRDHD